MQLLYQSLGDILKEGGPLSVKVVANLADQMMDALQHVHSHDLVHRDIKPNNIMLQNEGSWKLCLIDFGLTRPPSGSRVSTTDTTYEASSSTLERPAYVFGTLPFASLNAHERDSQLTFRDDLESLAYTLLWLLRGSLPWSHYAKCRTRVGRIRQVFAQKKRHTGSTMGVGHPVEFGELVDYARTLLLDEKPDYEGWRRRFQQVESNASDGTSILGPRVPQDSAAPPKPPIEVGQLVLVKLNPAITADGYTIREGHESSFISDPIFDDPEWSTTYRPAVVAEVKWDREIRKYQFLAIAISRKSDSDQGSTIPVIPITASSCSISSTSPAVHIEPAWPFEDSYCYVFRRPTKFYCLPSQEPVYSTWRISPSDCNMLLNAFTPPPDSLTRSRLRNDLKSPDPDIRYDARLQDRDGYCNLYAQVQPLTVTHIKDDSIDWFTRYAWFDECVKVTRYQGLNIGIWWTGAWFPAKYQREEGEVTDSYSEPDYSMWGPQSERRKSITLPAKNEHIGGLGEVLTGLTKIIALEEEPKGQPT
ncbi:unnamed protein product [Rhizoctonia solani]|nr:unnamed protein product [Rhizoctonia solani]